MRILIVEDDPVSALILRGALQKLGHDVTLSENGAHAWSLQIQQTFPIVITDWMMPEMNGIDLCRRIRDHSDGCYTYIIVLTVKDGASDRREALHAGADDLLSKPFDRGDLEARLIVAERMLAMHEKMRRLSLVASKSTCGVVIADAAGQVEWTNDAFLKLCGYEIDEIIGKSPGSFLQGWDTDPETVRRFSQARRAGDPFEGEIVNYHKNGHPYWVHVDVTPVRDHYGSVTQFIAITRDITANKKADDAIKASEERLRLIMENSSDLVTILDLKGIIQYQSSAVKPILGLRAEEMVGLDPFRQYVHPDDRERVRGCFRECIATPGATVLAHFRFGGQDGSWRHIESVATNLNHVPGLNGVVVNSRDVTERKIAEEREARQRERLSALHATDMAITTSFDLAAILQVFLTQVTRQLRVDAANVLLFCPASNRLLHQSAQGLENHTFQLEPIALDGDLPVDAARCYRARQLPGLLEGRPPGPDAPRQDDFVAYQAVPLVARGQQCGVLEIYHSLPIESDPEWFSFL